MKTTFGRYRLLELLGKGGMAEVFRAKSYGVEGFEKVVVIKRILPELAKRPEFVDMFIHEAKLAVRLSHANVVQVFDLGLAPGDDTEGAGEGAPAEAGSDSYYMAMEYVSGFDLATVLAKARRQPLVLPLDMCVYIAAEVAKGLDHAHRRRDEQQQPLGIVHRDVSPQNVLLSFEGEVKVTDFGIAKARGVLEPSGSLEDTRARKLQGKFAYMSPEQAMGENVDARSDLFSLGAVLYECLAGVGPFSAPSTFETLRRVQAGEYPPLELLRPDVPPDLASIVRGALAKRPDDRFADAGRMYEALLSFLYSHGRRFSAHDLADFLGRFRHDSGIPGVPAVDADDRVTPTDSRLPKLSSLGMEAVTPLSIPRPVEVGQRREVTAVVVALPSRETAAAERVARVLERWGGKVVERTPPQVEAVFGLTEPDGRDTETAARAALAALAAEPDAERPSAGLAAGRVQLDADGEVERDAAFAAMVSEASQLSRARDGELVVSAASARHVRHALLVEPLESPSSGDLDALGTRPRSAPTSALRVRDVRRESSGRFVGRTDELRRVGEVLALATKRVPTIVTLRGEHGIGKSRLLQEVERRLRKGGYNVGWYAATCPPRGAELPLSGIGCMLQALLGVAEATPEARLRDEVPRFRSLGLQEDEIVAVLGVLGVRAAQGHAGALASLESAMVRIVTSLAQDRAHGFAWDAAHAMDEESFRILARASGRLASQRVLFVLATRPGFTPPLDGPIRRELVELSDLRPEDAEKLVATRLGVDKVPPDVLRFVRERAGGNPLFVEELVRALVDAKALVVTGRVVDSVRLVGQELALPRTLRGLVGARVARLAADDRAILQAAAIVGDAALVAVLARMLVRDERELEEPLARLTREGFLESGRQGEVAFASPLVREVVADVIPPTASRELHAAAGRALEAVHGPLAREHAAHVATHWYEAGAPTRAAEWFAKSGADRRAAGQLEAAVRDLARSIELDDLALRAPEEVADRLAELAAAVRFVRSAPEAMRLCELVLARVDASPSVTLRVRARLDAGRVLGALHQFDAARAQLTTAEHVAQGDEGLLAGVLVAAADLAGRQGDFRRSLGLLERAHPLVVRLGEEPAEHEMALQLAQAHAASGDPTQAARWLERAGALLVNDRTAAVERTKHAAVVAYFAGRFRDAADASERVVDEARALGLSYEVAVNLHNLADALVRLGDNARAYGALRQSLALCDELGQERLASHDRMLLAYLDGLQGDAEAEATVRQGIAYAEARDFTWDVLGGRALLARLLAHAGQREAALAEWRTVAERGRSAGNLLAVRDAEAALAEAAAG